MQFRPYQHSLADCSWRLRQRLFVQACVHMFTIIGASRNTKAFDQVVRASGRAPSPWNDHDDASSTLSASQEFGVPATFQGAAAYRR